MNSILRELLLFIQAKKNKKRNNKIRKKFTKLITVNAKNIIKKFITKRTLKYIRKHILKYFQHKISPTCGSELSIVFTFFSCT